jgi:hypothetical protein
MRLKTTQVIQDIQDLIRIKSGGFTPCDAEA